MSKQKINIDDRLPKLKEKRRKRANKRLIGYLTFFFLLLFIIIYFQSPLSKISKVIVHGNHYISDKTIMETSKIKLKTTSFLYFDEEKTKQNLQHIKELDDIRFEKQFLNSLHIYVKELTTVGYIVSGSSYLPLLENGEVLQSNKEKEPKFNVPLLYGWKTGEGLEELAQELLAMNESVRMSISEIHYNPSATDKQKIILYMNDGFEVRAVISSLSSKLNKYPSLVAEINPKYKGVFNLEVGYYFTPYKQKGKKDENKQ